MAKSNDFLKIIKEQRANKVNDKFEVTFLEYLALVRDNPDIAKLAHKRLCHAIEEHGVGALDDTNERCHKLFGGETIKTYRYFEDEFFGMEKVIAKVMRFLNSASKRGEESRQVLSASQSHISMPKCERPNMLGNILAITGGVSSGQTD